MPKGSIILEPMRGRWRELRSRGHRWADPQELDADADGCDGDPSLRCSYLVRTTSTIFALCSGLDGLGQYSKNESQINEGDSEMARCGLRVRGESIDSTRSTPNSCRERESATLASSARRRERILVEGREKDFVSERFLKCVKRVERESTARGRKTEPIARGGGRDGDAAALSGPP